MLVFVKPSLFRVLAFLLYQSEQETKWCCLSRSTSTFLQFLLPAFWMRISWLLGWIELFPAFLVAHRRRREGGVKGTHERKAIKMYLSVFSVNKEGVHEFVQEYIRSLLNIVCRIVSQPCFQKEKGNVCVLGDVWVIACTMWNVLSDDIFLMSDSMQKVALMGEHSVRGRNHHEIKGLSSYALWWYSG